MREYELVEKYIRNRDYDSAINTLKQMVKDNPHNNKARMMIVNIMIKYFPNPDYNTIKKILRTAENMKPDDIEPSIKLCKFYMDRDNFDSAQRRIDKVLGLKPNNYEATFLQTKIDVAKGKYEDAIKSCEELLRRHDNNFVRLDLSRLYLREENYKDSFEVLNNSSNPDRLILLEKVIVLLVQGEFEQALDFLESNKDIIGNSKHVDEIKYYLNYMLGNDMVANTYFEKQLENYSSGSCIFETKRNYYHIRRTTIKPTFTCEVDDVKKIYGLIRELIIELEPISRGLCDKYIVDLGHDYGKVNLVDSSKILVKTINNTPYILEFLPASKDYAESRKKMS